MKVRFKTLACAAALAVGALALSPATPATAADSFYKGKTIKVVIRSDPGGGYDFYGRLFARHMPRHIPGNPDTIAVNMPGAGGIVATNYLMNRAKRDGTEMAIVNRELAIAQRTKATGVKYDVRGLIPVGSAASSTAVILLAKNHPVKTIEQLKTWKETIKMAVTGPGGGTYQRAMLLKLSGYPVEVITGYTGTQERMLAVARGDVQGTSNSVESAAAYMENLNAIAYLGNQHPDLKDVPNLRKYLTADARSLASLMVAPMAAGRPFFTTPKVPDDRVKLLRAAFKAVVSDPKARKEADKANRSLTWTDPREMEEIYSDILGASDEVITQFKKLM